MCCHGYKANLLGRLAARRARVAAVAVARGWTGENLRVRLYEAMDRIGLRGALRRGWWLAFLAEAPVAGPERPGAIVGLYAGWTPAER